MKRTAPLAIALALLLGVTLAMALRAPRDSQATVPGSPGPQLAIEQVRNPSATPDPPVVEVKVPDVSQTTEPQPSEGSATEDGAGAQTEQPKVKTGCGKAVPCPNRSCETCPFNIYLK
jgi:hypothetical protein